MNLQHGCWLQVAALAAAGMALHAMNLAAQGTLPSARYCEYEEGTLRGTLEEYQATSLAPGTVSVLQPIPQRRVAVVYTGRFDPNERWHAELRAAYSVAARIGRIFDYYRNEIQVSEGDTTYWMPLAEELRGLIRRTLSRGDTMIAYVDLAGAVAERKRTRWLFVLREFESQDSTRRWHEQACGGG